MLIYGFELDDLEEVRTLVERALGVRFQRRDSLYLGGDYFRFSGSSNEQWILFRNWDPIDAEPIQEPGACKVVMRIERVVDAERERALDKQILQSVATARPILS